MPGEKKRSRRRFTEEFKRDAAALVIDTGRPIAQVARELGVYESSLGRWVAQARADRGETDELTTVERARPRSVRRSSPVNSSGGCRTAGHLCGHDGRACPAAHGGGPRRS